MIFIWSWNLSKKKKNCLDVWICLYWTEDVEIEKWDLCISYNINCNFIPILFYLTEVNFIIKMVLKNLFNIYMYLYILPLFLLQYPYCGQSWVKYFICEFLVLYDSKCRMNSPFTDLVNCFHISSLVLPYY